MLLADIVMMDNTILNQVMLFKTKELGDSIITSEEEAKELLDFESKKSIYFSGKYVQGGLIPEQIMEYQVFDDSETFEMKIKKFVEDNSGIYDSTDIAPFIIDFRSQLKNILK